MTDDKPESEMTEEERQAAEWAAMAEGGDGGGRLVVSGTPEEVAQCKGSYTGQYLGPILARKNGGKRDK